MCFRLSVILLALVALVGQSGQSSFPAKSSETFRQRYGQAVQETYLVRAGIVASASYGPSGKTCQLVIRPKEPDGMIKSWSASGGAGEIDYKALQEVENELVPKSERGEYKIGGFVNYLCMPGNDCVGTQAEWENIHTYTNAGKAGGRYEVIEWNRDECPHHASIQP